MVRYVTRRLNLEDTEQKVNDLTVVIGRILSDLKNREREAAQRICLGAFGAAAIGLAVLASLLLSDRPYWIALGFFGLIAFAMVFEGLRTRDLMLLSIVQAQRDLQECGFNTSWTTPDPAGRTYAGIKCRWLPIEELPDE